MQPEEIREWSERKIEYVKKYVRAYATIFNAQRAKGLPFHTTYIDAFAGAGEARRKGTGEQVLGSPLQVLDVGGFDEYHFIDLNGRKLDHLRSRVGDRADVHFHEGDCNQILVSELFPQIRRKKYRRAFCFLDPYGLHLRWDVFRQAGQMETIEILVNFSIMDANMNILLKNPDAVDPKQAQRFTAFWGDETWREAAYTKDRPQLNLFGAEEKAPIGRVADAFCRRLRDGAGFAYVANPHLMKSTNEAPLYYLVFASPNEKAAKIASQILHD